MIITKLICKCNDVYIFTSVNHMLDLTFTTNRKGNGHYMYL